MKFRWLDLVFVLALAAMAVMLYRLDQKLTPAAPVAGTMTEPAAPVMHLPAGQPQMPVAIDRYREMQQLGSVMTYLSGLKVQVAEYTMMEGKPPRYLSDLLVQYPEVNDVPDIEQVRMLDGGSVAAKLSGGGDRWMVLRYVLLDSYPHSKWECEMNFEPQMRYGNCTAANFELTRLEPGVNCASGQEVDQFVCRYDRLMDTSWQLQQRFEQFTHSTPETYRFANQEEQRAWLDNRVHACPDSQRIRARIQCLDQLMWQRIDALDVRARAWREQQPLHGS